MSTGWSIYVIVLTVITLAGSTWLLWVTSRHRGKTGTETTGHVWDGITEYNKPMPRWWIILFYATIVWGIGYMVWYPSFGIGSVSGWTSVQQLEAEKAAAEEKLRPLFERFAGMPVPELARDPHALRLGRSVFANNCATCHGSDARGARGFPNLADDDWQWGGDPQAILASILDGRTAVMPALASALGESGTTATAVHVQALSGQKVDAALAAQGRQHYQMLCVACHGPEGRGNEALGAPDLTDDVWLYGGDFESIRESLVQGRSGRMPAHEPLIGSVRSRLAAAWVYSLSQPQDQAAGSE